MELQQFVKKIISSIEFAVKESNKGSSGNENVAKSDINFDIVVEVNKDTISVLNSKEIEKNKTNLNRIKFSIKNSTKKFSLSELAKQADKKK